MRGWWVRIGSFSSAGVSVALSHWCREMWTHGTHGTVQQVTGQNKSTHSDAQSGDCPFLLCLCSPILRGAQNWESPSLCLSFPFRTVRIIIFFTILVWNQVAKCFSVASLILFSKVSGVRGGSALLEGH